MELYNIEFSGTPDGDIEVREQNKPVYTYTESNIELTNAMWYRIENFYTEAATALREEYTKFAGNRIYFTYRMAHRFIRCNFREHDRIFDINHNGQFHFEQVSCPLIGECLAWGIICNPQFNTSLTPREMEVMGYIYDAYSPKAIATKLSISIKTVETHKSNSFRKLSIRSISDFMLYAQQNNLFKK